MKKCILLVVNTSTYFSGLIPIARQLKKTGKYAPFFCFCGIYPTIKGDQQVCRKEKIDYVLMPQSAPRRYSKLASMKNMIFSPVRRLFPAEVLLTLKDYWAEIKAVKNLIRRHKPVAIILAADIVGYNTSIFVKIGHELSIPSVVIPQWMASPTEPAEYIFKNPDFQMNKWRNRLAGKLYPKWVYTYKGKRLLRLPASQVIAKELFGLAPKTPWILHSGQADVIALESDAIRTYCEREGLNKDKMKVVGSISNDILFKVASSVGIERDKILEELSLDAKKPIILTPMPPDFLYVLGGRPECDFPNYKSLIEFWVKSLTKNKKYNVVVSLHPSDNVNEFSYIKKWGAKISNRSIVELIPVCDLFVSSVSATIQWAIACSKPVLNYDVYKYRYHDYDSAKGVITVESKSDFIKYLKKLAEDKKYLNKITKLQKTSAPDWGILDGKSRERLIKIIKGISKKYDQKARS